MDLLTHVFLPLTVAYVLRRELLAHPATLAVGVFGLLPDFDKFLGAPGLLHSLVTLVPLCGALVLAERRVRGEWTWAPLVVAFVGSHLVLDFLDGGPVPLAYPLVERGIGLTYPARTVFGTGPVGVWIDGPLVALRVTAPRPGFNTYGFLQGAGIAWLLAFGLVYVARERRALATGEPSFWRQWTDGDRV